MGSAVWRVECLSQERSRVGPTEASDQEFIMDQISLSYNSLFHVECVLIRVSGWEFLPVLVNFFYFPESQEKLVKKLGELAP